MDGVDEMTIYDKDIAEIKTIPELEEIYNRNMEKIHLAYVELQEARDELRKAFACGSGMDTISKDWCGSPLDMYDKVKNEIKSAAWRYAYNKMNIKRFLSVRRMKQFDDGFYNEKEIPEFSAKNVYDMLGSAVKASKDYLEEAILEVYEYLRPAAKQWNSVHKTNMKNGKYALGNKVIITGVITSAYGRDLVVNNYYGRDKQLIAVDRVFHALDGKSFDNDKIYVSELVDAINTQGNGETEYFKFKAYKNGNLHLEFKRMDLVQKLNQIAGNQIDLQG